MEESEEDGPAVADCEPAAEALYVDWARKAARKLARNGRLVDMVARWGATVKV